MKAKALSLAIVLSFITIGAARAGNLDVFDEKTKAAKAILAGDFDAVKFASLAEEARAALDAEVEATLKPAIEARKVGDAMKALRLLKGETARTCGPKYQETPEARKKALVAFVAKLEKNKADLRRIKFDLSTAPTRARGR